MSNLFAQNGQNLDNVFEPIGSLTKRANVNVFSGNTDISNLYAPVSAGSAAPNTGIFSGNTDIGQLFAALGSVSYWSGSLSSLPTEAGDVGNTPASALVEVAFLPNGEIRIRKNHPFYTNMPVGFWAGDGATGSNTQIRFVLLNGSLSVNNASSFSTITVERVFAVEVPATTVGQVMDAVVRIELREANNSGSTITRQIEIAAVHNGDSSGGGTPINPF